MYWGERILLKEIISEIPHWEGAKGQLHLRNRWLYEKA